MSVGGGVATGRGAVTLDLWHTLVYLPPEEEERYLDRQMDLAAAVLAAGSREPGTSDGGGTEYRAVFESVYAEAVRAAHDGRSVPPARQIELAADRARVQVSPQRYLDGLSTLLGETRFRLDPQALEAVAGLRARGYRTAVISNTVGEPGALFRPILHRLGLDDLIETWVFSDELPWTKPSPDIFREALRRLRTTAGRTVHVGDGWSDIEGARRAGLRAGVLYTGLQAYGARYHALYLPPGWSAPSTDHRIGSLGELGPLVDRLLGGP